MNYKFELLKELYPDYIIYIKRKEKLFTCYPDQNIIKYFDLDKYHINYLILDNLTIENKVSYVDNCYNELFIKSILINIINKCKEYRYEEKN